MLTRIITSIAALAVFAAALMLKPIVFTVALSAVIFVMLYECYHAAKYDMAVKISGICLRGNSYNRIFYGKIILRQ